MRRRKLGLAALVVMVAVFAAFTGPAMANDRDGNNWRNWNNGNWNNWDWNNNYWNNGYGNWWNNGYGNNEFVPEVIQAPAETYVSGSNTNNAGSVYSTGNNSNTCSVQQNFNNSGGYLNQQQSQQYDSASGGNLFLGGIFNNAPEQSAPCSPTIEQSASSSSY